MCMIPRTKEFFISLKDHDEWGVAHTVWGEVGTWVVVCFGSQVQPPLLCMWGSPGYKHEACSSTGHCRLWDRSAMLVTTCHCRT